MPEGQVLEFSRVTKRFGGVTAVSELTARVEPGRVTGFLGPNGAGKTTTLRILLGLVSATAGTATIGGDHYSSLRHPLQTVGAVLEASSFHPGRTAANHLKVYAQAAGLPPARVEETLGLVGLADVGGRKVGGFSLGMRQRLGLAYALLGDPGVLVLDEPANGLDPEGIKWMRVFLRDLAKQGRTVLVSSHMLSEVQQTVDALVIVAQGRLVYQGGLEDLADPSEYVTVVDSPDREALSRALQASGVSFELLRSGLTVRGSDTTEVGAIAASAGVALSSLQRRGPALEEVFLELISGARVHATANPGAVPANPGAVPANAGGSLAAVGAGASRDAAEAEALESQDSEAPADQDAATEDARRDAESGATAESARVDAESGAESASLAAELDAGSGLPPGSVVASRAAAEHNEYLREAEAPPTAGFTVASTGVIDIIPMAAGNAGDTGEPAARETAAHEPAASEPAGDDLDQGLDRDPGLDLALAPDGDPDVEALGEIDAELSNDRDDDGRDATAPAEHSDQSESADDDRPWEQYVKKESDVDADAFFAAFTDGSPTAPDAPEAALDDADTPDVLEQPDHPEHRRDDEEGGQR